MSPRQTTLALIAALAALPFAFAQGPVPRIGTEATVDAAVRSGGVLPTRTMRDADARHCLEFPSNQQVIMCAEKYRPHVRKP